MDGVRLVRNGCPPQWAWERSGFNLIATGGEVVGVRSHGRQGASALVDIVCGALGHTGTLCMIAAGQPVAARAVILNESREAALLAAPPAPILCVRHAAPLYQHASVGRAARALADAGYLVLVNTGGYGPAWEARFCDRVVFVEAGRVVNVTGRTLSPPAIATPEAACAKRYESVTYGQLAAFCRARGYAAPELAERFRPHFGGDLLTPAEDILAGRYADVIVPLQSVLTWYAVERAGGAE
jgi:hypothetical protein